MSLFFIALFLVFSCNSDSDFLPDTSVEDPSTTFIENSVTTEKNTPIIITPQDIDTSEEFESITITEVSAPNIGSAVINDKTITYTPKEEETGTDEFEYTATIINTDLSERTQISKVNITITQPERKPHPVGDNIYYVTRSGKSSNNGATESTAWSIQHAFKTAKAGDIVYIKAGNYGALDLVVKNSGNANAPIKFVGYKESPGDILATNGSTFKYEQSTYSTSAYPTIEGVRENGKVNGTAITIKQNYVEVDNFQIKNKIVGVKAQGQYNKLNNVIVLESGNYTGYSGFGVIMSGAHNHFTNSFIKNGTELFSTNGSHQLIENNWVGCDQDINDEYSTDYYLLLFNTKGTGANYNTVRNNTIYRQPKQYHQAHGLILKGTAQYNELIDNTLINCPLEVSMDGVAYNTVTGGSITGTGATGDGGNVKYAFILIANGAHHNTFQDMTVSGDVGVRFSDWKDGTNYEPDVDAEDAGNNNLFKNIDFNNLLSGIEFSWHWNGPGAATDNVFEDCTFTNIKNELFRTERPNSGTIMRNCTFINNPATVYNQNNENLHKIAPKNQKKSLNINFVGSTFRNNGFTAPQ